MARDGKRDAADGAVDSWVEAVAASQAGGAHVVGREHVRYTIDVREHFYVPRFELAAYVVQMMRSGESSAAKRLELASLGGGNAKYITSVDRTIGRLAVAGGSLGGLNPVSPQILATLLDLLVRSSRAHWRLLKEPVLVYEPLADASIAWQLDADGRQRLHIADRERSVLLSSMPLWYVDPERSASGPAQTQIPADIAAALASAPSLTDEQARRAHVALRHVFSSARIDGPQIATDVRVVERSPTPVLFLHKSPLAPAAELQFAYGEHVIAPNDDTREFRTVQNGAVYTWPRRSIFEKDALSRLHRLGFSSFGIDAGSLRLADDDERRWIDFIGATVPQLRAEGWRVEIDDEFPYVILDTDDEWHAELTETEARWFELELGVDVGGERVALLPVLIDALSHYGVRSGDDLTQLAARSEPIFGRLPSGAYVAL
ncbi:MAG: hypothetical protein JO165_08060, partial [Candidatus Eremiobacteraeota bacterium]|nr:hypothetical protein [Candidatus Eremiobacteraeota bacterium]